MSQLTTLRRQLNTLFSADLATYTTPSGATFPAIYIGIVPNDWRVGNGLEVNIAATPEMSNSALYQSSQLTTGWIVYLTHNQQHVLTDFAVKVLRNYSDATVGDVIVDNALQRYQLRITIPETYEL